MSLLLIVSQSLQSRAPVVLLMPTDTRAGAEATTAVLTDKVLHIAVHGQLVTLQTVAALEGEVALVTGEGPHL